MHRMTPLGLVICIGMALASTAKAKDEKGVEVKFDASLPVAAQIGAIEKAISSESYSEIGKEDKNAVQQALDRIQTRLGDQDRVDELDAQGRSEISKDQDAVNAILAKAYSDSRMTCRRERSTGSNMAQRVCMTAAQRRRAEEASRNSLDQSRRAGDFRP